MEERRIQYYDSLGEGGGNGKGKYYVKHVFSYIKDEYEDKKGEPLPNEKKWKLQARSQAIQLNGKFFLLVAGRL
jgi:hypothetical protein